MLPPLGELQLFVVCYQDEDRDPQDGFFTATTPEEAFALWRLTQGIRPSDHCNEDREAYVYHVPLLGDKPMQHPWMHESSTAFPIEHESLATLAIAAAWNAERPANENEEPTE